MADLKLASASSLARSYRWFVIAITSALLMLIVVVAFSEQNQFERQQQMLVERSVESAASQVSLQLSELRRTVRLFSRQQHSLLEAILLNPDRSDLMETLRTQVEEHFPEQMAFAIANPFGEVINQDIDSLVGDACRVDIQHFSITPQDIHTYLHPQPGAVHFDVMAHIGPIANPIGVFFVSFSPVLLTRLLAFNEVPNHELILLRKDLAGLVEMTSKGARGAGDDRFRLSAEDMDRVLASATIPGTMWNVSNLPHADFFRAEARRNWFIAGFEVLALVLVTITMLSFIGRAERRERRLRVENERLAAFPIENPNPVLTLDADAEIIYTNPAASQQRQSLDLSQPLQLLPENYREAVAYCITTAEPAKGMRREVGGRIFEWEFHAVAKAAICYAYGVDITDRITAESQSEQHLAELAHAGRLSTMGEMASGLAHELNQPLAAINSYLQGALLRLERGDTDKLTPAITSAKEQAQRAGTIIKRMREMVRKQKTVNQEFSLNTIVHAVLEMTNHTIRRHGVDFELALDNNLPPSLGDPIQVEQVVLNLVKNAAEAVSGKAEGERKMVIRTWGDESQQELQVEDNGPGLPGDTADQVFNPFYTTREDGMGMGLSISKTIIENHGGTLWAQDNVGPGASFGFRLPRQSEEEK